MANGEFPALCASCDRCRARKTRCDGKRPCGACKQKYMKKHKLTNVDGVDEAWFECFYSPAKRRGPVPGQKQMKENGVVGGGGGSGTPKRKQQSKKRQQALETSTQGGLSISIAEDGSVTSRVTGGIFGGMSISGMNAKMGDNNYAGNNNNFPLLPPLDPNAAAMQQHVLSTLGSIGLNMFDSPTTSENGGSGGGGGDAGTAAASAGPPAGQAGSSGGEDTMATAQNAAQQQLAYIQQLQLQQQMYAQKKRREMNAAAFGNINSLALGNMEAAAVTQADRTMNGNAVTASVNKAVMGTIKPVSPVHIQHQTDPSDNETLKSVIGCENPNVMKYIPLIHPSSLHGMHLRACYTLSFGNLFALPPIPTDEEYCRRFGVSLEPHQLPKFDVAALQAARFAELALGALSDSNCDSEISTSDSLLSALSDSNGKVKKSMSGGLLLALANASVLCLRDCVEERVHPSLMFDVSRAFFFHAIFRAQFGDMERYFKYRRMCLRHLAHLDGVRGVETLMAAISFQDSLAYMIYNASEDDVPNIDGEIPRVSPPHNVEVTKITDAEKKYGISISHSLVASNSINQFWIQGAPAVLINKAAPPKSRLLDALACAIRSSLDQAKSRQTKEPIQSSRGRIISRKRKFLSDAEAKDKSATEWAVDHHPEELSCSNLLAEASNLLKKDEQESCPALPRIFGGHRLLVSALGVFLNLDREAKTFQMQRVLNILEGMIERPILLFQGGPTYHVFNNCAIILAQIINELYAHGFGNEFAKAQFDVALDVYNGSRIVLEKHRNKLPRRLRCHEIPSPNIASNGEDEEGLIDFSNVWICPSHNCQDCIALGIPAKDVEKRVPTNDDENDWQRSESEKEFDVNDNALMAVLSQISSQEEKI